MRTFDKSSMLTLSFLIALLSACSSTQQQQQQQQLEDDLGGQENFGSNENFANEGLNNFEDEFDNNFENGAANEFGNNAGNEFADDGAGFNSAGNNEFGFGNEGSDNQLFSNQNFQGENQFGDSQQAIFAEDGGNGFEQTNNNQMFGLDNDQQAMFGQGEDINNAMQQEENFALQNTGNQGLDFENDQMMDNDQMANDSGMTVQEGGLVKYVSRDGTPLKDQPDGSTIRSLEQGDHPLVFEEGEWSRTSDGYYVSSIELTPDPVPRRKIKANWTY